MRRRSDRGEGYLRAILALAVVVALAYAGIKAVPVYVANYRLSDYIRDRAVQATVESTSADAVAAEVVAYGRNLGLPLEGENVAVAITGSSVKIQLDYTVPINLKLFVWRLHFTPSTENLRL